MSIHTIALPPEVEQWLRGEASRRGIPPASVEEWIGSFLQETIVHFAQTAPVSIDPAPSGLHRKVNDADLAGNEEWVADVQERRRLLHEWARSHKRMSAPLPDEALQRESFYPDRW